MKKKVFIFVLIILLIGLVILLESIKSPISHLDLINIKINENKLPSTINFKEAGIKQHADIEWQSISKGNLDKFIPYPSSPEKNALTRSLFIQGFDKNGYKINIEVVIQNYKKPMTSRFYYWYLEPKAFLSPSVCWNAYYEPDNYYFGNWDLSETINDESAYCCNGNDSENSCDFWIYKERYKQSIVIVITNFGLMEESDFKKIMRVINKEIIP